MVTFYSILPLNFTYSEFCLKVLPTSFKIKESLKIYLIYIFYTLSLCVCGLLYFGIDLPLTPLKTDKCFLLITNQQEKGKH